MIEEIIFAGFGGQGILLGGSLIAQAAMKDGLWATWFPSYGPEMRGGTCNCLVACSDDEIGSPIFNAYDTALIMNLPSLEKFGPMVRPGGLLMINSSLIQVERPRADVKLVEVPVNDLAREAGSDRAANVAMVGAYCAVKSIVRPETVADVLRDAFSAKGPKVVDLNLRALEFGRRAVDGVAV
jgi:2-oxoglutarate ferredoxin oxidoreductase subunit gamma